jgi:hypothetical protein
MVWVPLVVIPALAGFALGLASPGILSVDEDEVDRARRTLARASGGGSVPDGASATEPTPEPVVDLREPGSVHETVAAGAGARSGVGPGRETVGGTATSADDGAAARGTVAAGSTAADDGADVRGTVAAGSTAADDGADARGTVASPARPDVPGDEQSGPTD